MMTPTAQPRDHVMPNQDPVSALEQASGVVSLLAAFGLISLAGLLWRRNPVWLAPLGAACTGLAGVLWIFRNPERRAPAGAGLVIAPADGEIISIARIHEPRFLHAAAHQLTIRTHPGEVQITRAPVSGAVRYRRYQPAGQADQRDDTLCMGIRQPNGDRVLVSLTASSFWRMLPSYAGRRITCLPDLEDAVRQGQVIGHLPLGGLVNVYLPGTALVAVTQGQQVRAGETALAQR